jgi:hypothetical protein
VGWDPHPFTDKGFQYALAKWWQAARKTLLVSLLRSTVFFQTCHALWSAAAQNLI